MSARIHKREPDDSLVMSDASILKEVESEAIRRINARQDGQVNKSVMWVKEEGRSL
jgi:hypothetical protein